MDKSILFKNISWSFADPPALVWAAFRKVSGDPAVRAPTQQALKIAERSVAYNSGDVDTIFVLISVNNSVASRNLIIAVFVNVMKVSPKRYPQGVQLFLRHS